MTVSAYFRYSSTGVASSGGTPFTLGISGATTHALFNSATGAGDMILGRINKGAGNTGTLTLQTRIGGTASTPVSGTAFNFTLNGWYHLTTTLTRTATVNQFTFTTSLFNATSAGAVGTLVDSIAATTVTSASLYDDPTLFAGFRGFTNNGLGGVDNFAVSQIPEPSSFAALAGLGALGFVASRRRRAA